MYNKWRGKYNVVLCRSKVEMQMKKPRIEERKKLRFPSSKSILYRISQNFMQKENFNNGIIIIYALFELKQRGTHQFEHLDDDG